MKRFFVLISALTMILSMTACGGSTSGNGDNSASAKPEVIKDFEDLDTSKFHGGLSGDGYFLVLYEGVIDEAVMGAVLKTADGVSVTLSEETIVKNPDGNSLLFFEQAKAESGQIVSLTLEKDGYEKLTFDVTVEY